MTPKQKIRAALEEYQIKGYTTTKPFSIGPIEKRMTQYANDNKIILGSKSFYFTPRSITHPNRASKIRKGLAVSKEEFIEFPSTRHLMDLFWDGDGFIYTNYKIKFIVKPNYEIIIKKDGTHQKKRRVCLVTAGVVTDPNEFNKQEYQKI